ncbi:creatininase family protein [candidate division KSB1 bacterium]|nr:creatininase family protein [candidate division KSB1 bacterium]
MKKNIFKTVIISLIIFMSISISFVYGQSKALILQEMSWVDVQEYLKNNDMVIIPLGSTEQHGPHMPLGTDCYEAFGMSKLISKQTGVIVAPVLWSGYSVYHSGFPGTLSLKPETMEQVLFETAEMLMKYGFRRFMFFNYHGGNNIVQQKVIHRINHTTEAVAFAIGHGSAIQKSGEGEFFDWHAGKGETSIMLYLKPELVKKEQIENPQITFTPKVEQLYNLAKQDQLLLNVAGLYLGVPVETKKGGASHELSSNGIWSFSDVKSASKEIGKKTVDRMVNAAVKFIDAWKQVKK